MKTHNEIHDASLALSSTATLVYALGDLLANQRDDSEIVIDDLHALGKLLTTLGEAIANKAGRIRHGLQPGDA